MKRKNGAKDLSLPKKKTRVEDLPWKAISVGADMEGGDMLLGFEEVDGVTVEYSEDGLRTAKFLMAQNDGELSEAEDDEEEWVPAADTEELSIDPEPSTSQAIANNINNESFQKSLLPAFTHLHLCPALRRSLYELGFKDPTRIQQAAWKVTLRDDTSIADRDVVGVAETGSGKTLAYGVPILQNLISQLKANALKPVSALILTPTRELALQVKSHLANLLYHCLSDRKLPAPIKIIGLTGGMSIQKQRRQLEQGAHVIVATPGRLWDLISESSTLSAKISQLDFLVLDEADRMMEGGHYAELDSLFKLTNRTPQTFEEDFESQQVPAEKREVNLNMRNYVFSATMSRELQRNLKRPKQKRKKLQEEEQGALGALGNLLKRVDFRDPDPAIIDLLPDGGIVSTVKECAIECLLSDKDVQLYHFLLMYPGKTLVFLSSIDGIRRLHPIFSQLKLGHVSILHSSMQQRARLKAIDRFQKAEKAILFATDVAARGLDIPKVDHVVHFQLPRTSDTYIHRSGRTGRAGQSGVTLQLVAPEEKNLQRDLMRSLGKDVKGLLTLPIEWSIMAALKARIDIAKEIDQEAHRITKQNHDNKWLAETAKSMDIDLSSDEDRSTLRSQRVSAKVGKLKAQLSQELARPLIAHGVSARYITSGKGGQDHVADAILADRQHQHLIGRTQKSAIDDVKAVSAVKKGTQQKTQGQQSSKSKPQSKG